MQRIVIFFCLLSLSLSVSSQQCPPEWVKYTLGEYLYVIENDHNTKNLSETDYKNHLLNIARTNLAKQVEVEIQQIAVLKKEAVNGQTNITYGSVATFETDVNLKLVGTYTMYNPTTREGWAIAYINKQAAIGFYQGEVYSGLAHIESALMIAQNYVANDFKTKAKETLQAALQELPTLDTNLFWLRLFGQNQALSTSQEEKRNTLEQKLRMEIAALEYSNRICLVCTADLFGASYPSLQNKVKGMLATQGCTFVDNPAEADWSISITASAREYNAATHGNYTAYTTYIDAFVTITKIATGQRICEDELTLKGSHTMNYTEAARKAYKDITENIINLLKTHMQ